MPPRLSIVVPVYNRADFTRGCLECLRKQTFAGSQVQVIVVDDGSTDGTSEMIRGEFPEVVLLRGDGNLWWTGATNFGICEALKAGATHILTLNDDTLPTPTFLEAMMAAAAQNPRALVGAYAVDAATGRPVFGGARMNWATASSRNLALDASHESAGLVEVTHFPGRGLLIPREVFQRIGLFDATHFPHYLADYDFTCRARRKGYPIFCASSARLGIYPEASGDAQNRRSKGVRNYFRHLFHIKGGANLRAFFWFSLRNCPRTLLPICLPLGLLRRILGYPLEGIREISSDWWNRYASYRSE